MMMLLRLIGLNVLLYALISPSIAFSLPASSTTAPTAFISEHTNTKVDTMRIVRKGASQSRMSASVSIKGGSIAVSTGLLQQLPEKLKSSPDSMFNGIFAGLMTAATVWKVLEYRKPATATLQGKAEEKPAGVKELQIKFLSVFWLLRMAEWLQGPYFYEVYASKSLNGRKVSLEMISRLFLVGFASTGLFGPWIGRLVDVRGRKLGKGNA